MHLIITQQRYSPGQACHGDLSARVPSLARTCIINHLIRFETLTTTSTTNEYDHIQRYSENLFTLSFLRCSGRLQGSKQIWHEGLAIPIFIFHRSEIKDITGSQLVQSSQLQYNSNTPCKGADQERKKSNHLHMPRIERGRTRRFGDTALDRSTSFSNGDKHLNHNSTQGQFCFRDEIMCTVSNSNGMVRSHSEF
jgi:hypothetical protein